MNEMMIFNNPEFGSVRTVCIDGEPWLVGKDVAEILGYSNTRAAILRHVDEEDLSQLFYGLSLYFQDTQRGFIGIQNRLKIGVFPEVCYNRLQPF